MLARPKRQPLAGTYTFSKLVPDLIQVVIREESLRAPISYPLFICINIMKGEYSSDVLPFAMVGGDSSPALFLGKRDHLVDHPQAFSLILGLGRIGRCGLSITNAV